MNITAEIVDTLYDEFEDKVVVALFGVEKEALVAARLQDASGVWGYDTGDLRADATISMGFVSFCIARGYTLPTNGD